MSNGGRRPLSLQARSLLAAGVVLAAFLGITGLALDRAIHETLLSSLQDRLRSYAEGYIAKSEVSRARRWIPPDVDPEGFVSPNSGLYAGIVGPVEVDGAQFDSWRSPSALVGDLPFTEKLTPPLIKSLSSLDFSRKPATRSSPALRRSTPKRPGGCTAVTVASLPCFW